MAFVLAGFRETAESLASSVNETVGKLIKNDGAQGAYHISDLINTTFSSSLRIPCDVRRESVWLSLAAIRAASACASAAVSNSLLTTTILTGVLGLAHIDAMFPSKSRVAHGTYSTLSWAALRPISVVERGEYWRLITAPISSSTTTSFLTNLADLIDATSVIEAAWGSLDALQAVLAASAFGQLMYVFLAYLANVYYPELALAKLYHRYTTGLSISSIAVRTLSGYLEDEKESETALPGGRIYRNRYGWAISVMLNNSLLRLSSACLADESGWGMRPYAALEVPGVLEVTAGVATGVMMGWRERDLVLGLTDLALQGLLLTGVWWSYGWAD